MVIRKTSLIIVLCCTVLFCSAQDLSFLLLEDINIDSTSLENARYKDLDFGKIINVKKWEVDYEDYIEKYEERRYDSMIVQISYINDTRVYTDLINIKGRKYLLKVNSSFFKVGDDLEQIRKDLPVIYEQYVKYVNKREERNLQLLHFDYPIKIININNTELFHYGSLKFGIMDSHIQEIILDFRPDGEYD